MSVSGFTESSVLAELSTPVRRKNAKTKNLPGTVNTIGFIFFLYSVSEYTDSRRCCSEAVGLVGQELAEQRCGVGAYLSAVIVVASYNPALRTERTRRREFLASRNTWTIRISVITMLLAIVFLSFAINSSKQKAAQPAMPKFSELSYEDRTRLAQQRAIVTAAAKQRYGTSILKKTVADLPVLQRLIDDKVFNKKQTYELQSLGIAFGDVLENELPLRWVMVTDEYGTDPTLRFKGTTVQINALTMISKRVEKDQNVNLSELLRITREELTRISQNGNW